MSISKKELVVILKQVAQKKVLQETKHGDVMIQLEFMRRSWKFRRIFSYYWGRWQGAKITRPDIASEQSGYFGHCQLNLEAPKNQTIEQIMLNDNLQPLNHRDFVANPKFPGHQKLEKLRNKNGYGVPKDFTHSCRVCTTVVPLLWPGAPRAGVALAEGLGL